MLIPPSPIEEAGEVLDDLDGLIISGGGDVDPSTYGLSDQGGNYEMDTAIDQWEIALIKGAQERKMPFLGICRGMQVLNVAFGGTLHQEMTSEGGPHEPVVGEPDSLMRRRHTVELKPGSRLAAIYGAEQRLANTLHHQAPEEIGTDLEVAGCTSDGHIEALEHQGEWYALGVQWHPERLETEEEAPLFKDLVDQAAEFRGA